MPRNDRSPEHELLYQVKAEAASRILWHDRYWSLRFLRLLLDRIDTLRLEKPEEAHSLALVGPELVRKVPLEEERGGFGSPASRLVWLSYSYAVLGSACRVVGQTDNARLNFGRAGEILNSLSSPPRWARAQLFLRHAIHCSAELEPQAEELLSKALELGREASSDEPLARQALADALCHRAWRAYAQGSGSPVLDYSQAMEVVDRKTMRGQATYDAALQNLLAVSGEESVDLAAAVETLRTLLRQMPRAARPRRLRAQWAQGRLLTQMGLLDEAIRVLEFVWERFRRPTAEVALLLVDYGAALVAVGDERKLLQVIAEAKADRDLPASATGRLVLRSFDRIPSMEAVSALRRQVLSQG